eukprot:6491323-Amphidinium_carterae.1
MIGCTGSSSSILRCSQFGGDVSIAWKGVPCCKMGISTWLQACGLLKRQGLSPLAVAGVT